MQNRASDCFGAPTTIPPASDAAWVGRIHRETVRQFDNRAALDVPRTVRRLEIRRVKPQRPAAGNGRRAIIRPHAPIDLFEHERRRSGNRPGSVQSRCRHRRRQRHRPLSGPQHKAPDGRHLVVDQVRAVLRSREVVDVRLGEINCSAVHPIGQIGPAGTVPRARPLHRPARTDGDSHPEEQPQYPGPVLRQNNDFSIFFFFIAFPLIYRADRSCRA